VVPDGWNDPYRYVGMVTGEDFIARGGYDYSYTCSGALAVQADVSWEGQVSGRFSSDGNSLTATEIWSYGFGTGQKVTVHIHWTARRQ
jgi:hypothetical protein